MLYDNRFHHYLLRQIGLSFPLHNFLDSPRNGAFFFLVTHLWHKCCQPVNVVNPSS